MPSDIAAPRDRGGLPAVLAAGLVSQAIASWAVLALAAIAPEVAGSFDVPVVLIGYQISLLYAVGTVASLVAGALVMRWGACRTSQIVLVGVALAAVLATLPSLAAIVLATMIVGFVYGLTNPSAADLLARNTTAANRSLVFSVKQTGVPIGGIAAGLVTPLLAVALGWQAAVAAIAPAALLAALALQPFRASWDRGRRPKTPIAADTLRGIGSIARNPQLVFLCLFALCFGAMQLSLTAFTVAMAVEELGFGAVLAGGLLAAVQVAGVAGRLFWGFLADRLRSNVAVLTAIAATATAAALAMPALGPDGPRALVFLVAAVFGASVVGWNGVFLSETVRLSLPDEVGTATGLATFWAFAGVIVGPAAFVSLYGLLGSYLAVYGVLAVPAVLAGVGLHLGPALVRRARGGARP